MEPLTLQESPLSVVMPGDYWPMATSFGRALRARGCSPATLRSYGTGIRLFGEYLATAGRSLDVADITPSDLTAWLNSLSGKPTTRRARYKALQAFCSWLVKEGDLDSSPMANIAVPLIKEERMPSLIEDGVWAKMLRRCAGRSFAQRRDMAILRVLLATPIRLNELAALRLQDVDLDNGKLRVLGKGGRYRDCTLSPKAEAALDIYLRIRAEHQCASSTAVWLGKRGSMTADGIYGLFKEHAIAVGHPELHPHDTRATWAATHHKNGGTSLGALREAGWSSELMYRRYCRMVDAELARDEVKRLRIGDRV